MITDEQAPWLLWNLPFVGTLVRDMMMIHMPVSGPCTARLSADANGPARRPNRESASCLASLGGIPGCQGRTEPLGVTSAALVSWTTPTNFLTYPNFCPRGLSRSPETSSFSQLRTVHIS